MRLSLPRRRAGVTEAGGIAACEERGVDTASAPPCLVHLVRAANGLPVLRAFAESLRRHPPGIEHDLVLAMKGFPSPAAARPYLDELSDLDPQPLFFPDEGLDLGVYFGAAGLLRRGCYCFVNSFGRPLVDGWLAKLTAALRQPGVGLAGATGSWASIPSWMAYSAHLPSAYRGVLPPVRMAREQFLAIELERSGMAERPTAESLRVRLRALVQLPEQLLGFESFPADHLRTNAFMVSHATLGALRLREIRSKIDAYVLESGRASITKQVQRLGLRTVVVDRAGALYEPERWDRSRTLWQGGQEGLLVEDNQTLAYARGDAGRRRLLSGFAWGSRADPDLAPAS
ncbi:MAG TPA: hypothetical protein VGG98_05335 [Solirubrobacteraceae bacterium]|jgi:hypothetical protein